MHRDFGNIEVEKRNDEKLTVTFIPTVNSHFSDT